MEEFLAVGRMFKTNVRCLAAGTACPGMAEVLKDMGVCKNQGVGS